ncbi:dipeptidyl aminopeptidase/acylaminoacyl peptidase [Balneicella halophila]|uniref:Dipeptidyl aminopeptidase/acylaminoacyl peptidase n=1 Tax=Balneicella halophila TaxID=1537566 RepID=A0A7L4UPL0_BALHA|nr:S9 family peptidase [Balneicella halophila]PVX51083.1 dipeptidyl aminopeptidase/acylaminoacyl peptidase [Balneicella halophila]
MNLKQIGILAVILMTTMALKSQDIAGDWKGTLDVQGMQMEIIFHIANENGVLTTTIDVPAQGATGIPIESTEFSENTLKISSSQMQMSYEGTLADNTVNGTYKQAGMELPLTLNKFESKLPGNPDLVSSEEELAKLAAYDKGDYKYDVADYFAKPKASSFQLSPDGKYMSYMEKAEDGKRHVYVKEIVTGEIKRAIEEKEELIKGYGWVNNERLIYGMDKGGDENIHIYATNLDGSNDMDLTPFDGVKAMILNSLKDQKDYIIVGLNKNNPQVFEPYKLNIVTGDLVQLFENTDPKNPIQDYEFDKDGELRGYSKLVDGITNQFYYKDLETGEFNLLKTMNWDDTFAVVGFAYDMDDKNIAYVATNLDSDKARIVLYDLKYDKIIKEVFSNPDYDATGMSRSRKRNYEIDYFSYTGEKSVKVPVSETYKKLHAKMEKQFPNMEFGIVDFDDDETQYLIITGSDKLVGTYYTYDVAKDKFTLLYDLMPQLNPEDMAEMRPITFKSRDGYTIHGYITLPEATLEGKKVPMIVNPHGGPQGIRDSWGFNPEAQLFASRGYATLQINFRISGGYGKKFLQAGFNEVGRKVMDDIEDGVKYVIEQGWIDEDKIAIYGASHGGYATLMGLIKTPDLYTCGVDYVGVSNIFTLFDSMPEYWKPFLKIMYKVWYDLNDEEQATIAKEVSPVFQVDKIKKPLFVVQGANDPRVNINESDQIVSALRAKGFDVPYMVKYNEGHGFAREENRLELYKYMLGFFAKHLK